MKICSKDASAWPDWIVSTVGKMSSLGASNEYLLDFLAIVAQEIETSDLLPVTK